MEIRDVIHGPIVIGAEEKQILDSPFFQRLRYIKQLGFSESSYPGATHHRFSHSLGAFYLASRAFEHVFHGSQLFLKDDDERFQKAVQIAAMLHDLGHGPLSHTSEVAMPQRSRLNLAFGKSSAREQATHEDYTLKILLDSSFTSTLEGALHPYSIKPIHIACILDLSLPCPDDFFRVNTKNGEKVHLRTVLHQLISSEIDVDRMDYLNRDSYYAGVQYGKFDIQWLLKNLSFCFGDASSNRENIYLCLKHKGLYTFEDFLLSRYHMFFMVYFHHKSIIFDEMLKQFFLECGDEYQIPADIETYLNHNDFYLHEILARSKNQWAKRIVQNKPYQMYAEVYSDIPMHNNHEEAIEQIREKLQAEKREFIEVKTKSEISKYFNQEDSLPLFVHYESAWLKENIFPLEECSHLYSKDGRPTRSITRFYVPAE